MGEQLDRAAHALPLRIAGCLPELLLERAHQVSWPPPLIQVIS